VAGRIACAMRAKGQPTALDAWYAVRGEVQPPADPEGTDPGESDPDGTDPGGDDCAD
jgi:hypothetical protein